MSGSATASDLSAGSYGVLGAESTAFFPSTRERSSYTFDYGRRRLFVFGGFSRMFSGIIPFS